ncbi:MAG: AMP-binding protein [Candidatus Hydrogenedentota bacterium]
MISNWSRFTAWPAREMKRLQDRLLVDFLREDLVPFSSYYAKLFDEQDIDVDEINAVSDLAGLPFTTKSDLIAALDEDPLAFVLRPTADLIRAHWPLARKLPLLARKLFKGEADVKRVLEKEYLPIFMTATTGRAAKPVSFLYTRADMYRLRTAGRRTADVIGLTSADRCINLFPYAPHLAFWQVAFAGFESGIFMLSTGGGKTIGTAGNIRAMEKVKPTCLLGVPSYVYHILRCAEKEGLKLSSINTIVLGAEKVPPGLKERLSDLVVRLGGKPPRVVGTYGFTEAKMAWSECDGGTQGRESSGYHLYPDMEIIEIVEPETGRVVGEGESGEIVYTSLDGRGTAVLRYRTGDYCEGGITYGPCPHCGKTLPRLSSNITRLSNVKDVSLTKVKGTLVDLNHIASLLSDASEIEEWQLEISKLNDDPSEVDVMTLSFTPVAGARIEPKEISRRIFDATEVALNKVEVLALPEMVAKLGLETELKEKRIIDRRAEAKK